MTPQQVTELINLTKEGFAAPLATYIELAKMHKHLTAAMDEIKHEAITQAANHGVNTFKMNGCTVTMVPGRSMYDFKGISAWKTAKAKLEYIETIAKAGGGVDPETGEVIDTPMVSYTAESISIKPIS